MSVHPSGVAVLHPSGVPYRHASGVLGMPYVNVTVCSLSGSFAKKFDVGLPDPVAIACDYPKIYLMASDRIITITNFLPYGVPITVNSHSIATDGTRIRFYDGHLYTVLSDGDVHKINATTFADVTSYAFPEGYAGADTFDVNMDNGDVVTAFRGNGPTYVNVYNNNGSLKVGHQFNIQSGLYANQFCDYVMYGPAVGGVPRIYLAIMTYNSGSPALGHSRIYALNGNTLDVERGQYYAPRLVGVRVTGIDSTFGIQVIISAASAGRGWGLAYGRLHTDIYDAEEYDSTFTPADIGLEDNSDWAGPDKMSLRTTYTGTSGLGYLADNRSSPVFYSGLIQFPTPGGDNTLAFAPALSHGGLPVRAYNVEAIGGYICFAHERCPIYQPDTEFDNFGTY